MATPVSIWRPFNQLNASSHAPFREKSLTVETVGKTVGKTVGTVGETVGTVGQTVGTVGPTVGQTVETVGQTVGTVDKTVETVGPTVGTVDKTVRTVRTTHIGLISVSYQPVYSLSYRSKSIVCDAYRSVLNAL